MVTTIVKRKVAEKMISEAVERGLITPFEENIVNRAVDVLRFEVKRLLNSDVFTGLTEEDLDLSLAEDLIEEVFNSITLVVALKGNGIKIEFCQTNYEETDEGLDIISIVFNVILMEKRAGSVTDITNMIRSTKGINHHIISPKHKVF